MIRVHNISILLLFIEIWWQEVRKNAILDLLHHMFSLKYLFYFLCDYIILIVKKKPFYLEVVEFYYVFL